MSIGMLLLPVLLAVFVTIIIREIKLRIVTIETNKELDLDKLKNDQLFYNNNY